MGINIKTPITTLLLLLGVFTAMAQKLPRIQEVSLRAPADIKIDGKPLEWHNKYQADNATCRIFYTVSNDETNLYLVIHTQERYGNLKVLQGGITLTVDAAAKGEKPKLISVTYPAVMGKMDTKHEQLESHARYYYNGLNTDTIHNKREIDSVITLTNKELISLFNEVQVSGIKEIGDPLISVYNTDGIKAAARFDSKMIYNYELAIPLKYLGDAVNSGSKFRYNIKLNAHATIKVPGVPGPPILINNANVNPNDLFVNNATDFWGNYTLAQKQ